MPLWLQITFLAATIPTVLIGLFLFAGKFKSQDCTKNGNSGSTSTADGSGDFGGDCDGGGGGD